VRCSSTKNKKGEKGVRKKGNLYLTHGKKTTRKENDSIMHVVVNKEQSGEEKRDEQRVIHDAT
jgi:hypothetical protein